MKAQYIVINSLGTYYYSDKAMTELHRKNGPAVENANGTKFWFLNGKKHRTNGPAIEYSNGTNIWLLNGIRHRENGPAIEYSNGYKVWYINGKRVSEQEHRDYFNPPKPKTININGKVFTVEQLNDLIKTAE